MLRFHGNSWSQNVSVDIEIILQYTAVSINLQHLSSRASLRNAINGDLLKVAIVYMVYVVQREDCQGFAIAGDIDPTYAETLLEAKAAGVEAICYACKLTTKSITLERALPIHTRDPS